MIPGTSKSILVKEFKRLTKINFNVRMPEVSKIILTKNQARNAFDLGSKNGKK